MDDVTIGMVYHTGYHHRLLHMADADPNMNHGLHTRYRLLMLQEGAGLLQIGGQAYPLITPAVCCLNEHEVVTVESNVRIASRTILFHPALINHRFQLPASEAAFAQLHSTDSQDAWCLQPFLNRTDAFNGVIVLDPAAARHLSRIADNLHQVLVSQPDQHWPCRSRSYLMELLFMIERIHQQPARTESLSLPVSENLSPVLHYLHMHYSERITLDELARLFATNKTTLNERFKRDTGLSTIAYLQKLRLQIASALLRSTLLPASEIMQRVGIHDDAHFIRSFRKFAGISPAQYRKQHCWMLPRI